MTKPVITEEMAAAYNAGYASVFRAWGDSGRIEAGDPIPVELGRESHRAGLEAAIAAMPPIKLPERHTVDAWWSNTPGQDQAYSVEDVKQAIEAAGLRWEETT